MKAAPVAPPPPSWTGFYVGGSIGYLVQHDESGITNFTQPVFSPLFPASNPASSTSSASSYVAGLQVGYNWQVAPRWVLGIEGDWDATNPRNSFCRGTDSSLACSDVGRGFLTFSEKTEWLASVRGRAGYVWDRVLFYGTAGGAWGKVDTTQTASCAVGGCGFNGTSNFTTFNFGSTRSGWVAGAGAEAMVTPNWTVRFEWLHYDLGNLSTAFVAPATVGSYGVSYSRNLLYDTVRLGVNYKL